MRRRWLPLCVVVSAALAGGCGGDGDDDGPPAAVLEDAPTTERTTTTTSVEAEVEAAYLRSWDVYAEAVLELDDSKLDTAYRGRALEIVRTEVAELKADGTPVRVAVEHDYTIRLLQPDLAEIEDNYTNHTVLLDAQTGEPLEPDPNERLTDYYVMQEFDGEWLVMSIER